MPDQVTTRIQAALTAEAARMAEAAQVTGASGAGHQPGRPRPRQAAGAARARQSRHAAGRGGARRLRLPELRSPLALRALGTAAVAVVIAGGVYGLAQLAPSGQSSSTASGSSAAGERLAAGPNSPVLHYRSGGRLATFTPFSTRTNFQRRRLTSQVSSELQNSRRNLPTSGKMNTNTSPHAAPTPAGASLQHGSSFGGIAVKDLQGCVTRIAAGGTVRLVDVARYQGKRATIIVVAGGTGGTRVFVVGPGCSGSRSDLIAQASLPGAG
jgi:hypothetical protein